MNRIIEALRRALFLFRRDRFDRELEEEMRFHLDMKIAENIDRGMTPDEARYDALRRFGNRTILQEQSRDIWLFAFLEEMAKDLRYGVRVLLKNRVFTAVAVVTLAIGIGANTAIFSVVDSVLLRPLPFEEPDRLVTLDRAPFQSDLKAPSTHATFLDWRDQLNSFEQIAAVNADKNGVNLTTDAEPERVAAREVTTNFFDTLGVMAHLGRTFYADEAPPGKNHVAVLGYGLWQRAFGGDADLIGKTISLNGNSFDVIGIAPPGFDYPGNIELWIPIAFGSDRILGHAIMPEVIGRLKPGLTIEEARVEAKAFSERIHQDIPEGLDKSEMEIQITPLLEHMVKRVRLVIVILFGAVAFVLLIACANVGNLLLARATARQKELAIRAALGAGRMRLIRQLLVESLLLSIVGGCLGVLLALWGIDILVALSPEDLPRINDIGIDARVLGFTVLISLVTGVLFGLVPALKASNVNLNESLKEASPKTSTGPGRRKVGNLLVVAEVALAIVLLAGAGLLIKSFARLMEVEPGFNPENVLTATVALPTSKYKTSQEKYVFFERLIERLKTLPDVQSVGAVDNLPLSRSTIFAPPYTIEGMPPPPPGIGSILATSVISPGYLQTIGVPLLEGRHFDDQDKSTGPKVALISKKMAERYWPGESPIGKRLTLRYEKSPREIVGVVGDTKRYGLESDTIMEGYFPATQSFYELTTVAIRTGSNPLALVGAVRGEVQSLDKELPIYEVRTMEDRLSASVAQRRFTLILLTTFAAVALALAAVGVYGMLSYAVSQRTHEIGIRMALGARTFDVINLVIRQAMLLVFLGVALGIIGAFALTRVIEGLLYGVSATDPIIFLAISFVLVGVALFASAIPARKAVGVNPIIALRYE